MWREKKYIRHTSESLGGKIKFIADKGKPPKTQQKNMMQKPSSYLALML